MKRKGMSKKKSKRKFRQGGALKQNKANTSSPKRGGGRL